MHDVGRRPIGRHQDAAHEKRIRYLLLTGAAISLAFGLWWGAYFALRRSWYLMGLEVVVAIVAACTVLLARQGRTRAASALLLGALFALLCFGALVLDVPDTAAPRSIHVFFLSLGVVSCILVRDEAAWWRLGLPLVFFASFGLFACTTFGFDTPHRLSDTVRTTGLWINYALSLLMLYVTMIVVQSDVAERSRLETELRSGLARNEMVLHYQPQFGEDGQTLGAEALVRWLHPGRGMVPPNDFIPLAERSGLILPLGDWVLRTACMQLARWAGDPRTATLRLAVNVSALQFAQFDFVARVMDVVRQTGAAPTLLKLELTETMLAHDVEAIIVKMKALKAFGVGCSLDDFGTGFSSLSYLSRLPLDQLKIDQSFVRSMVASPHAATIARTVVNLGDSLGLDVIAEGVETPEQHAFLRGLGCRQFQGYLFSRPLPIAEFDALALAPRAVAPASEFGAASRSVGSRPPI
jgi:EAL domain-containing protein (putative c-di-GMP-specific phosphodiesterase class I)